MIADIVAHSLRAYSLIFAFAIVGAVIWLSYGASNLFTKGRIHGSAIAIAAGLVAAYVSGRMTGGPKGLADFPALAGFGVMGGAMLRDFAIVSTAFGADLATLRKVGPAGALSISALEALGPGQLAGKTVVAVVSGGNFDFERLPDVKERAMRYAGTKKYFILRLPQRPGALRDLLSLLGPEDDIARFEYLKKSARNFGSILIGIETGSPDNFLRLVEAFDRAGLSYQDITDNEIIANLVI